MQKSYFEFEGYGISSDVVFRRSMEELFQQNVVTGSLLWRAYSSNGFNNALRLADGKIYEKHGWFAEAVRDKIIGSQGTDNKGRLRLTYVSNAGTDNEKIRKPPAPESNTYIVPNDDCPPKGDVWSPFHPDTLVPLETVRTEKEAVRRFEKYGIDPAFVSMFHRLDDYSDGMEYVAVRDYDPRKFGLFGIDLGLDIHYPAVDWLGSRITHRKKNI